MSDPAIDTIEHTRRKNPGYHDEIRRTFRFLVPPGSRVLELGCSTGRLLASVEPSSGLGIDTDPERIDAARRLHANHPELSFEVADAETFDWSNTEPFEYIILSDLVALLDDIQSTLARLQTVCRASTRLVINFSSNVWRPPLSLASRLGQREEVEDYNWLSMGDMQALLSLAGFETITTAGRILLPTKAPGLSWIANRLLAKVPLLEHLDLTWFVVARPLPKPQPLTGPDAPSVSIVVPTLDEAGNVEGAFSRTTPMGSWSELVFVDGGSTDGTIEEIERCREAYKDKWPRVKLLHQSGKGKGQAVHQAFAECEGKILMILDSDLTMPPEELPKYYEAITLGRGEMINGCRLVYPMHNQAMRTLNMVANHAFSKIFTYLMGQPVRDTLCGTKVMWRRDYETIWRNRAYFGEFDPFGDFDLLFGAAKQTRKILDLPIRYRAREYGDIKISRWRHGVLLLGMSAFAFKKLKLSS